MAQRAARIVTDSSVLGGEPHVEGRRISVLQVYEEVEGRGLEPRTVADRYDLDVAAVYRALAYYHENPKEMASVRDRRQERIEAARGNALTPEDIE